MKDDCPAGCKLKSRFDDFIDSFDSFVDKHETVTQKINDVHREVTTMGKNTEHLQVLPEIAKEIRSLRGEAFSAAIGKKQVPLPIFLIVMFTMCVIFLLRELGSREFHATPGSLDIKSQQDTSHN